MADRRKIEKKKEQESAEAFQRTKNDMSINKKRINVNK